jgi:hypothetical protein
VRKSGLHDASALRAPQHSKLQRRKAQQQHTALTQNCVAQNGLTQNSLTHSRELQQALAQEYVIQCLLSKK